MKICSHLSGPRNSGTIHSRTRGSQKIITDNVCPSCSSKMLNISPRKGFRSHHSRAPGIEMELTNVTEVVFPSKAFNHIQSSDTLGGDQRRGLRAKFLSSLRMAIVPREHQGGNRNGKGSYEDQACLPEVWFEDPRKNERKSDKFPVKQKGDDKPRSRRESPRYLREGHGSESVVSTGRIHALDRRPR